MTDSPDTKVPLLVKLDSSTRLLGFTLKEDITASAQYYPYPLPRDEKPESKSAGDTTNGKNTAAPDDGGNDRSIIVYGTKKGLTILYPQRCRLREREPSSRWTNIDTGGMSGDGDGDVEMGVDESDWVICDDPKGDRPEDDLHIGTYAKTSKYESYSESEGYGAQRNACFPWKFLVELDSPVIEFAVPGPSHSVPEHAYLASHPWLEKMYLAAITADGKVHLVILPLRLPPPGVSSSRIDSKDFPVHTMPLKSRKGGQTRPKGICLDFMRRLQNPASS
ncbi:hypothetical protein TWF718_001667 [Orbilia javanica]|uniref:Uncharacterized protein n=1 Tax=Orbilia javanica TaxID=47235 RepID=A0AAN8NE82_9PEZI